MTDPNRRFVVLHYHLFKNAGTTVDEMLHRAFGRKPATREFRGGANADLVGAWITETPDAVAFSSHTANLPVPDLPGTTILPIVFVRHPLDRIRSAYEFERRQSADTFGATLARGTDFAGYLRGRLDRRGDRQCRNFHCERLAYGVADPHLSELERALASIERLPFVGVVDRFEDSRLRLDAWLGAHLPGFSTSHLRRNTTARSASLDERVTDIAAEIGPDLFDELMQANADDFTIYREVSGRYATATADVA